MIRPNRVEIELSSRCNAACPGCKRTRMINDGEDFQLIDLDENDIYERFSEFDLTTFKVKLCGVLGDPLIHPKMLEISKWFATNGAYVEISTNGALRGHEFWHELGTISKETGNIDVRWAVDGLAETNHIYRVNTDYSRIASNMQSYAKAGGKGIWIFIEFDHNMDDKEEARRIAEELGFGFLVRRAAKNSVMKWEVKPKTKKQIEKTPEEYKVVKEQGKHHEAIELFKKTINDEIEYNPDDVDCKFYNGKEFFLASNGTVWPCCFFWDEYQMPHTGYRQQIVNLYGVEWNDYKKFSFTEIFSHEYYASELPHSWEKDHGLFRKRCFMSCGGKGKLRNSFAKS